MSSRRVSMDVSRSSVVLETANRVIQTVNDKERDQEQCENQPSAFCAEQTWPTEDEIRMA